MSQITSGLRSILSSPTIYSAFQAMMGGKADRAKYTEEFIRPFPGYSVLDIGCGPAGILDFLPEVDYWGFDVSEAYIEQARKRFGERGRFHCQILTAADVEQMPKFDIVLAQGLLHHLDDEEAAEVTGLAHKALKPGGRLLTIDPCLEAGQNPIARFLVMHDRGQHVRSRDGYTAIARTAFDSPRVEVRHKNGIPYTHCFMECTRK